MSHGHSRPAAAAPRKPNVATGRSILVVIWHLLADPDARYTDLGAGFYASRTDPERRRNHVRQLEILSYTVILERAAQPAAPTPPGSAALRQELPRAQ